MAASTRAQATCLLLLLLTSLASGSVSRLQTGQLLDPQTRDAAAEKGGLQSVLHRLRRRDTHIPICIFCCGCCNMSSCGMCCKT
ncbi:hepcidin [Choloepus didactylus]|uniref:hepcidin n=1 Tax=Choloepus didactylus TaxID=27675 RepID=UPI00189FAB86|nr:hepcidin [Choloepus didactylus]